MGEIVGCNIPLIDGRDKVIGKGKYTDDLTLGRILVAKVVRSSIPHGKILNIDISKARQVRGVRAVLTGEDCPKAKFGETIADENILCLDRVRYAGDELALIVADCQEAAEEASNLLRVEYEGLPAVFTLDDALREDAPLIHQERENNAAVALSFRIGELEDGYREADLVLEEEFSTSKVYQAYLEPNGAIAQVDGSGRITLMGSLQEPSYMQDLYARALELSPSNLRIVLPYIGGGFGGKLQPKAPLLCTFAALRVGESVKLIFDRKEDFQAMQPRVPMRIRIRLGIKRNGILTAKEVHILADNGAYTRKAKSIVESACFRIDNLYRIPNLYAEAKLVYTNNNPTSAFRGYGNAQMHFALESMLDIAAREIGMDPLELRLKNCYHEGEVTVRGAVLRSCGIEQCLKKIGVEIGQERKEGAKSRGWGIAGCVHISGSLSAKRAFGGAAALIKLDNGKAVVYCAEPDLGQGAKTVLAQIASEELGLSLEEIVIAQIDTDIVPWGWGTFASRASYMTGNAVRLAAQDAKKKLLFWQSQILAEKKGHEGVETGEFCLTVADLCQAYTKANEGMHVWGFGSFSPPAETPDTQAIGNASGGYPFGVMAAEVEVDEETGLVKVLRVIAVYDIGRPINPALAKGQIEGGIAQGLGWALMEDITTHNGKILNPNFSDYRIPTAQDLPGMQVSFVDTYEPTGPFGAKSVGEAALLPVAPAIANAVACAVGVRVKELPLTPEKILQALVKGKES